MSDPVVRIPEPSVLAALGAIVMGAFGWLLRLERRSANTASRMSAHEHACEKRQVDLKEDLTDIKKMLERQDEDARVHRERMNNAVHAIGIKVAVIQTELGHPPSGDTGRHLKPPEG